MVRVRHVVTAMVVALVALPACAQVSAGAPTLASGGVSRASGAVREIFDPATGNHWVLERQGPGAPGRLVLAGNGGPAPSAHAGGESSVPVIRAGTPVTVVTHTPVMDAELQATALTTAAAGAEMRLRLKIGGRVVRGVAIGLGRAEWLPESGPASGVRP